MNNELQIKIEVQAAFDQYMTVYFKQRNAEGIFSMLGDEMSVIGTAFDEIAFNIGLAKNIYLRDLLKVPNSIDNTIHNLNIQGFAETVALVTAVISIKFINRGGKVRISALLGADGMAQIAIRDSGIGMDQEMVKNLFRIDIKTNRNGTEGESSTGLGLLLCKEFVEKHSGYIWVESDPEGKSGEKGSVFYFTLPILSA